jgi:hypothetical protein
MEPRAKKVPKRENTGMMAMQKEILAPYVKNDVQKQPQP